MLSSARTGSQVLLYCLSVLSLTVAVCGHVKLVENCGAQRFHFLGRLHDTYPCLYINLFERECTRPNPSDSVANCICSNYSDILIAQTASIAILFYFLPSSLNTLNVKISQLFYKLMVTQYTHTLCVRINMAGAQEDDSRAQLQYSC